MGYLHPVEVRGADRFAREATDAGVDGVLLVDLPPEEADGFREAFAAHGLALVLLASPTTTPERLETLCSQVQGYLYYRSEEHTSELQSLMRISYAVFCLKKKTAIKHSTLRNSDLTQSSHV